MPNTNTHSKFVFGIPQTVRFVKTCGKFDISAIIYDFFVSKNVRFRRSMCICWAEVLYVCTCQPNVCVCVCLSVCLSVCLYGCMYVSPTCVCVCACLSVCLYVYMVACMFDSSVSVCVCVREREREKFIDNQIDD
jgi:hypothetical protein